MVAIFTIVASLLAIAPAHAAQCRGTGPDLGPSPLCSVAFDFNGTCGVAKYPYPHWETVVMATGAWEKSPIRIVIASADAMVMARGVRVLATIFAGNSYNADLMTPERAAVGNAIRRPHGGFAGWLGRTLGTDGPTVSALSLHSEERFADGMLFPSGLPMESAHLDVHLDCQPKGAGYAGSLAVWYRLER